MLRGSRAGTMEHAVDLGTFVGRFCAGFVA